MPHFETDSKVQFVIDAVYAFAHALNKLKSDVCPTLKGVCRAMTYYDGGDFYKNYLLKVNFSGKISSQITLQVISNPKNIWSKVVTHRICKNVFENCRSVFCRLLSLCHVITSTNQIDWEMP